MNLQHQMRRSVTRRIGDVPRLYDVIPQFSGKIEADRSKNSPSIALEKLATE